MSLPTLAELPPERAGENVFLHDGPLVDALVREGAGWAQEELCRLGDIAGAPETIAWGFSANEHPPTHVPYDRSGRRVDGLELDEGWHRIMELAVREGLHGAPWADPRAGAHVARAAKFIVMAQVEAGFTCPIAMTYSCVPALRLAPEIAARWEPLVTGGQYDPRPLAAVEKRGALIGMALTERAGGSDVRGNATVARPIGNDEYECTGNKWFVSALMSDAYFILAQAPRGLSLLFVPRHENGVRVDRLKRKLGNHSNPTGEVDLDGAVGTLVGEEGGGVRAIMSMIAGTRHDCVLGSVAVMRLGLSEALHWCAHRRAFGRTLAEQPAMRAVLADLALELEGATAGALRLSRAIDEGDDPLQRIVAPALKFWTCKRAPAHVAESVECLGGLGYIEESRLPRAYREAPLMSIWEGSGNVQALDGLRALRTRPECAEALLEELELARGTDSRFDQAVQALHGELAAPSEDRARALATQTALCLQAALLLRHAPAPVADAFCATRLGGDGPGVFGMLPAAIDVEALLARAWSAS
ncbi:MAG TPA: acyl-CoA dehydrogenase family protein [Solirubrobacteraceae bacterium]|nr:acyl-CoA dehydrogenase family protein [Solirubrobacteraceae bacterium]